MTLEVPIGGFSPVGLIVGGIARYAFRGSAAPTPRQDPSIYGARMGGTRTGPIVPPPPPVVPPDYYPPSTPEFPSDTPPPTVTPPGRDDEMIFVPPLGPDDVYDEQGGYTPATPQPIADVQTPPPRIEMPSSSSSSPSSPPATLPPGPDVLQEQINRTPHDYEGFDLPGEYRTFRIPRPVFPGEIVRKAAPRIGGIITRGLGPIGNIISIFTPGSTFGPEILGSGELPPVERLETIKVGATRLPLPEVTTWPTSPPPIGAIGSTVPQPAEISLPPSAVKLPMPAASSPSSPSAPSSPSSPSSPPSPRTSPTSSRSSMTLPRSRTLVWPILSSLATTAILRASQTTQAPFSWPTASPSTPVMPIAEPLTPPRPTDPLTPPRPTVGTDPLTPPAGNPLTTINATQASFAPPRTTTRVRTKECRCDDKAKKRKKPRECLARGSLVWSSGPKKGQSAGSRCLNFRR